MNLKCDKSKEEILTIILNHLEKNEELSKLAYNEGYSEQYYSGKYDAIADLMDELEIYV